MTCADLIPFCDGDLVGDDCEAFQRHLAECATCPDDLLAHMQIDVRLRELGEQIRARPPAMQPELHMGAEIALSAAVRLTRWQRFRAWLCKW